MSIFGTTKVEIDVDGRRVTVKHRTESLAQCARIARQLWEATKPDAAPSEKPLSAGTGFQVERSSTVEYVSDHQADVRA